MNYNVADVTLEDLGHAGEVVVTKEDSLLLHGKGEQAAIQARVKQIQTEIEESNSNYEKEKLQERLARLADGVAVIKVSGVPSCTGKSLSFSLPAFCSLISFETSLFQKCDCALS